MNAETARPASPDPDSFEDQPPADVILDAAVDRIVGEWASAVPKLDREAKAISARIARIDSRIRAAFARILEDRGLLDNEYRLMAGLVRIGAPNRCSPSVLAPRYVPVTSGGLTGVINRLERRGLVRRVSNPLDQRSVLIELTEQGNSLIRDVMADLSEIERRLMSELSASDKRDGNAFLRKLLRSIEHAIG